MTTPSNAVPEYPEELEAPAPAPPSPTRPLYWSVRRELWENRSIYVAPLAVALVVLFGFSIRTIGLPQRMRALAALDPTRQLLAVVAPYSIAASVIIFTTIVVGLFYCIEALHGERRDRSILFWKSLPVSDRTTVLSKASIPLVVLPVIGFTVSLAAQMVMLAMNTLVLLASGVGVAPLLRAPWFQTTFVMAYGITVHALWFAPLYGWLMLVSAWARRATFLWAVLPLVAVGVLEGIVFQTTYFGRLLRYRLIGAMGTAFAVDWHKNEDIVWLSQLSPARFLTTPGLWLGLIVAAAFLAAAAKLRRNRDPI
jgi:ABC-2 type transport system permease protein